MAASINWTKAALEKLAAHVQGTKSSNYEITDPKTAGLKLQIGTSGRKFFWFRYTYRGEKLAVRVGEFGPMSIEQARVAAQQHRATLDLGGNPQDVRQQLKSMPLVREFADEYIEQAKMTKITYKNDIAKFRDHILPVIGDLRLCDASQRDIQMLLGSLKATLSPATINRVHALLSVFFNLAVSWKRIAQSPRQSEEAQGVQQEGSFHVAGRHTPYLGCGPAGHEPCGGKCDCCFDSDRTSPRGNPTEPL